MKTTIKVLLFLSFILLFSCEEKEVCRPCDILTIVPGVAVYTNRTEICGDYMEGANRKDYFSVDETTGRRIATVIFCYN